MKKKMAKAVAILLSALSVFGFGACGENSSSEKEVNTVTLVPIANPKDISPALGYDYYLAAEPLASAKVKATANTQSPLHIVGDLQKLYGGENGYPQAVLVAKNTFLAENVGWVETFVSKMSNAAAWLKSEITQISTIVSAVSSNLTEDMTPSLSEGNLTKAVIENCGVRFVNASDSKAEVNVFLSEMRGVSVSAASVVADKFFYEVKSFPQTELTAPAQIYMPDGAPALSMAQFMSENRADCAFHVVDASTIVTYVTGANPKADLCVLPLNAASKLLGTGEVYTMLGTVTHGNLYLLSTDPTPLETAEGMNGLANKRIGTIQIENVPGLTLKLILKKYGLAYEQGV